MNKLFDSHSYEYKMFCATTPKLSYDSTQIFADWQNGAREKLCDLLGLPLEMCEADLKIEYTKEKEDCLTVWLIGRRIIRI